jgi:hypothetical protein
MYVPPPGLIWQDRRVPSFIVIVLLLANPTRRGLDYYFVLIGGGRMKHSSKLAGGWHIR